MYCNEIFFLYAYIRGVWLLIISILPTPISTENKFQLVQKRSSQNNTKIVATFRDVGQLPYLGDTFLDRLKNRPTIHYVVDIPSYGCLYGTLTTR